MNKQDTHSFGGGIRPRLKAVRGRSGERGQVLPMVAFMMLAMLGVAALTVDVGRVFIAYHQLQASTDAAALAGAQGLPTSATAIAQASTYSSVSGDKNVFGDLSGVTMVPVVKCLTFLKNLGESCDGTTTYNAIQVSQTISIPTSFAAIFGTTSVPITATATAASKGVPGGPANIAVILDQTASMGAAGSDSCTDPTTGTKYTTRNACSLVGLKILLLNTAPCLAKYTTCPTGGTDAVDMISVFVFPNFEYSTGQNAYTGSCSAFTHAADYTFPYLGASYTAYPSPTTPALSGTTADYQLTPFLNDYRTSDNSGTLNTSSDLVRILGPVGGSSCAGLKAPGGLTTFYAGALAAAQGALLQEQTARGGVSSSKNSIILLSDGEANASLLASTYFNTTSTNGGVVNLPTAAAGSKTYPYYNATSSKTNQCQQGVSVSTQIASDFASNPTTIYTVAYGSSTNTSDCTTDSGAITPCDAMAQMASSSSTFFSDYTATNGDASCTSAKQPFSGLAEIFGKIAGGFAYARLIPNGTT
jgi:hypothetical protein